MIKKTIITTAAILLAGVVLFGRNTIGYIRTSLGYVHDSVENSVPVGFEIDHARHMIQDLVPEVRKNMHVIAKEEVGSWPVIRTIARLGRTVFVRRSRASTGRERDDMHGRLAGGDSLILFPEGTTSDGSRVLPFRTAFLSIAEMPVTPAGLPPIVQPVSVVYDRLGGLPMGRASRPLFAWYGDMDIGSHFWRLAQHKGLRATVLLHQPLDPLAFPSRKALAATCWDIVADGASTLRQNRPARPNAGSSESGVQPKPAFV